MSVHQHKWQHDLIEGLQLCWCPDCGEQSNRPWDAATRTYLNTPAVLLRDTPQDRERLAQAIRRAEYPDTKHGANYRDDRKADAIIAALRGRNAGFYDDPNAKGNER